MGLVVDYFNASSDAAAASVIEKGPRRAESRSGREFVVVDGLGVEPVVELAQLEVSLAGRRWQSILEDEGSYRIVGDVADGEVLVIRLGEAFENALLALDDADIEGAAMAWSETEEFAGQMDTDDLAALVFELKDLVRRARQDGEKVYAWVSV